MEKDILIKEYDRLQKIYGSPTRHSVYGGGEENNPKLCLVFINPTARNIATSMDWTGVRYQWLGTKQIWKFLSNCDLFSAELNQEIQNKKAKDWDNDFCIKVYDEVKNKGIYITNLAKCTQDDARPLKDAIFMKYRDLLLEELDMVNPEKVLLFGNQVSSIVLGEKISVSECRTKQFKLKTKTNTFDTYAVYYPVGNGFFNADKAIDDIKIITSK